MFEDDVNHNINTNEGPYSLISVLQRSNTIRKMTHRKTVWSPIMLCFHSCICNFMVCYQYNSLAVIQFYHSDC